MSIAIRVCGHREGSAGKCRKNGWVVGTRLVGDEGFGPTVIEITAIGEQDILAKTISHNGVLAENLDEAVWTLDYRDWKLHGAGQERPASADGE